MNENVLLKPSCKLLFVCMALLNLFDIDPEETTLNIEDKDTGETFVTSISEVIKEFGVAVKAAEQ